MLVGVNFSDLFCNIRNTPIKSDRSIFLSFVYFIIYLLTAPAKAYAFANEGQGESFPLRVSGQSPEVFGLKGFYLPWFSIIIARTFMDRPNRLMNPSASLWL